MSYNGVGLRTVRGSGTNGYIQKNRSSISHLRRNDNPADLKPPVSKTPNAEIIEHEKKRQIELKVLLYEEQLKERKTPKEDIKRMCKILREQLREKFARDPSAMKSNLSESHQKNAAKLKEDAKLRNAFGISKDHVEGVAYEQIGNPGYMAKDNFGKAAAIAAAKARQKEKEEKELAEPKLPRSFLLNSVYTEEEDRERKGRNSSRGGGGDHWRPARSFSRSRSRDRARGKGSKRSRSGSRSKSKSPARVNKKTKEETSLALSLLKGGDKKDKKKAEKDTTATKQKTQKKKKKKAASSSSESSSSSSSDSSSDSSSSSGSDSDSSSSSSSSGSSSD